jgi:hypothetical protein
LETLKPGRELDALVAEKMMEAEHDDERCGVGGNGECLICDPEPYSTDIASAWQVVNVLSGQGYLIDIQVGEEINQVQVDKLSNGRWEIDGESTPGASASHAICLAALKVVGVSA